MGVWDGSFGSPPIGSYLTPINTYGVALTAFELYSLFQKRFRPSVRPSDLDAMTNTAIKAIDSSSGKKFNFLLHASCHSLVNESEA